MADPTDEKQPDPETGERKAKVRRDGLFRWTVFRTKPDGSYDWATEHLTEGGAAKAAIAYERTGEVQGRRP